MCSRTRSVSGTLPDLQHGAGAHTIFGICWISTEDADIARVWRKKAQQQLYRCGLASSVRA